MLKRLVDYLHRAFNRDPAEFPALRIEHADASFVWAVSGRELVGSITDGEVFRFALDDYTLAGLVAATAAAALAYAKAADALGVARRAAAGRLDAAVAE
jgi:hypothetical protein